MSTVQHGPHSNPVWSTFIFVMCMLLFLFYLETMIKPMDLLVARSFVIPSHIGHVVGADQSLNNSLMVSYDDLSKPIGGSNEESRHTSVRGLQMASILVFLHIQKTAGKSFNAHIALDIDRATGPRCSCSDGRANHERDLMLPGSCLCDLDEDTRSTWLFSRLTVGWPCGVHAGWTELTAHCLDNELNHRESNAIFRRYSLFTMLRDPVARYISEWRQVSAYGQWPIKKLYCHPLADKSYFNGNWTGVSLDDFLSCPDNPANNRQVRMLADLSKVAAPCSRIKHMLEASGDVHNNSLLDSAVDNLQRLPFFGLLEYPEQTDVLFQWTFGVTFSTGFSTNSKDAVTAAPVRLSADQGQRSEQNNKLDLALYKFAKQLFFERYKNVSSETPAVH